MPETKAILIVDMPVELHQFSALVNATVDASATIEAMRERSYEVVIAPARELASAQEYRPHSKIIAVGGKDDLLDAVRRGAFSFFSTPFHIPALAEMAQCALKIEDWENDILLTSGRSDWVTVVVRCKMSVLDRITQLVRELENTPPERGSDDLAAAVRELVANGIEHGGHSDPGKWLRISRFETRAGRAYHIQDPGEGFSFGDLPHAALGNPPGAPLEHIEARNALGIRPGGFGILLSRNLSDELIYNEKGNEVLLIKYNSAS
jgi:anti-sigma regulatory factor (Ser/Thr protein kinase)